MIPPSVIGTEAEIVILIISDVVSDSGVGGCVVRYTSVGGDAVSEYGKLIFLRHG